VLESYDSTSDAFTEVTAAGTDTPGTYEFNVTQDAYSGVGVDYSDTANVTLAVENLDANAPVNTFDVTLDNQADRSQMHISAAEIESPDVLDVTTTTDEPWLAGTATPRTRRPTRSRRPARSTARTRRSVSSRATTVSPKRLTPRPKTPSRATSSTTSRCRTMRVSP